MITGSFIHGQDENCDAQYRPLRERKSCQTEAVGSSLDKTLTNHVNWDWFVSKLWRDQLWQTTFAGNLAGWRPHGVPTRSPVTTLLLWVHTVKDDLQEIVSFSQSAAVWLCQQAQFDSKCFPLSNRLSIVLFTDGGSVTSERSTFWGLGRRTTGYPGSDGTWRGTANQGKMSLTRTRKYDWRVIFTLMARKGGGNGVWSTNVLSNE